MNPFDDLKLFEDKNGTRYRFVRVFGDKIIVWRKGSRMTDEYRLGALNLSTVNEEILTAAGIWDELPETIKTSITNQQVKYVEQVHDKMAVARQKRKKKYDFSSFPEFLKCKCGREVKANYYMLQKKADEKKIPLEDLVNAYVCQTCCPTIGRKKKTV